MKLAWKRNIGIELEALEIGNLKQDAMRFSFNVRMGKLAFRKASVNGVSGSFQEP